MQKKYPKEFKRTLHCKGTFILYFIDPRLYDIDQNSLKYRF